MAKVFEQSNRFQLDNFNTLEFQVIPIDHPLSHICKCFREEFALNTLTLVVSGPL